MKCKADQSSAGQAAYAVSPVSQIKLDTPSQIVEASFK